VLRPLQSLCLGELLELGPAIDRLRNLGLECGELVQTRTGHFVFLPVEVRLGDFRVEPAELGLERLDA